MVQSIGAKGEYLNIFDIENAKKLLWTLPNFKMFLVFLIAHFVATPTTAAVKECSKIFGPPQSPALDEVERMRFKVSQYLPPSCRDDFQRLSRSIIYGPAFQWMVVVDTPQVTLRKQVIWALDEVLGEAGLTSSLLQLSNNIADVAALEDLIQRSSGQSNVIHIVGGPDWFNETRWNAMNLRRERLAANVHSRIVVWLNADAIDPASIGAPDLWAWRSGVYSFVPD